MVPSGAEGRSEELPKAFALAIGKGQSCFLVALEVLRWSKLLRRVRSKAGHRAHINRGLSDLH